MSMTQNIRFLLCSKDMQTFMEANKIGSIPKLFDIKIDKLVLMPDFPFRLLDEWITLRDKYNFLNEN